MIKAKAGPVSGERIKSFIERVEKLLEERKAIQSDIKDVFSEAKGVGYNVPIMRKVIALRAMDVADRDEQEALIDTYMLALETVDRVQARVAAGESVRAVGAAEGVSRSTAHRLSQKGENLGNGTEDDCRDVARPAVGSASDEAPTTLSPSAEAQSRPDVDSTPARPPRENVIAVNPKAMPKEVGAGDPRPEGTQEWPEHPAFLRRVTA